MKKGGHQKRPNKHDQEKKAEPLCPYDATPQNPPKSTRREERREERRGKGSRRRTRMQIHRQQHETTTKL